MKTCLVIVAEATAAVVDFAEAVPSLALVASA